MIEREYPEQDLQEKKKQYYKLYMKKYREKKNPKAYYEAQLRYVLKKLAELQQED